MAEQPSLVYRAVVRGHRRAEPVIRVGKPAEQGRGKQDVEGAGALHGDELGVGIGGEHAGKPNAAVRPRCCRGSIPDASMPFARTSLSAARTASAECIG